MCAVLILLVLIKSVLIMLVMLKRRIMFHLCEANLNLCLWVMLKSRKVQLCEEKEIQGSNFKDTKCITGILF